jgi:hypothetical protein
MNQERLVILRKKMKAIYDGKKNKLKIYIIIYNTNNLANEGGNAGLRLKAQTGGQIAAGERGKNANQGGQIAGKCGQNANQNSLATGHSISPVVRCLKPGARAGRDVTTSMRPLIFATRGSKLTIRKPTR